MNNHQLLRYSRHILLDAIGIEGQERIVAAHALIIGLGGLGSAAAFYLASAGVGTLTLVDDDLVDLTNLQRQIIHTTSQIGQPKVQSAQQALLNINPEIQIVALKERVDNVRLNELVPLASIVMDCSDNFKTRHAINRACVAHRVPLVSGAAISFSGQVSVFDSRKKSAPCYACLFSPDQPAEEVQCATMGVFAPLVGVIGSMQAAEALKLMVGMGDTLSGRLLLLESLNMTWNELQVPRNPCCLICGDQYARH